MAGCTLPNARPALAGRAHWQSLLADSIREPAELCRLLDLDPVLVAEARSAAAGWPLLVPWPYAARIRPGDPDDPLLLQVLPRAAELAEAPGYRADPLGEGDACCAPGLLGKYQGRILMVATRQCAVHCRFCFRRSFCPPTAAGQPEIQSALAWIANQPSVDELIVSGGDPLTLPDAELSSLMAGAAGIGHLRRVRIHTRMPIVVPQRITTDLILLMRSYRMPPIMVIHVNHPREIDGQVADALGRLADAGIPLLSQSVLLRDVNDRVETLAALYGRLVDLRVIPYYLHHLDPVAGVAKFEVPISAGLGLIAALRARLPGYAVPRYVRETRGATSKEVLA